MSQLTLRFPRPGLDRLEKLCVRHGVSIRALFEAAAVISLEDEADPERHDMQVAMWGVVRDLERSAEYQEKDRVRVGFHFDDCLLARLQDACRRFGVSQNAALVLVVMRWPPSGAAIPEAYRRENLCRIVTRARQLDFTRRGSTLSRR